MRLLFKLVFFTLIICCTGPKKESTLSYASKGKQIKIIKLLKEGYINQDISKIKDAVALGATLNEVITINSITSPFIYSLFFLTMEQFSIKKIYPPVEKGRTLNFFKNVLKFGGEINGNDKMESFFSHLCSSQDVSDLNKIEILEAMFPKFDANKEVKITVNKVPFYAKPLYIAIISNSLFMFKKLTEYGADINYFSPELGNYLHLATLYHSSEIAKFLIENNQKVSIPDCFFESIYTQLEKHKYCGAKLKARQLINEAFYNLFSLNLINGELTILNIALNFFKRKPQFLEFADDLLELKGEKVSGLSTRVESKIEDLAFERAPLSLLKYENFVCACKLACCESNSFIFLIFDWININYPESFSPGAILPISKIQNSILIEGSDGKTAFSIALAVDNLTFMHLFITAKNVNETDSKKQSLLHLATQKTNIRAILKLLSIKEIDVNAQDMLGNTALHYAVKVENASDRSTIITLLLSRKPKILPNKEEKTAIELAKQLNLPEIASLLKSATE